MIGSSFEDHTRQKIKQTNTQYKKLEKYKEMRIIKFALIVGVHIDNYQRWEKKY